MKTALTISRGNIQTVFMKGSDLMHIDKKTVGKNLKLLRTARGISQEELAGSIRIARSTYASYEAGVKIPDLQTLDALSALYDVSFDSMVNYDMTQGLIHRIYFNKDNREIANLLNDFQGLSISSKFLISQKLELLIQKEYSLYASILKPCGNNPAAK